MNRRFVMAVTCVPMPPDFFDLPLRQMMLPLMGPFPVNSQILAINSVVSIQGARKVATKYVLASIFQKFVGSRGSWVKLSTDGRALPEVERPALAQRRFAKGGQAMADAVGQGEMEPVVR